MAVLFPFANVGRISPIITHCADYVELFMRTYIGKGEIAHHEGQGGKVTSVELSVRDSRIRDLLRLFVREANPPLHGTPAFVLA